MEDAWDILPQWVSVTFCGPDNFRLQSQLGEEGMMHSHTSWDRECSPWPYPCMTPCELCEPPTSLHATAASLHYTKPSRAKDEVQRGPGLGLLTYVVRPPGRSLLTRGQCALAGEAQGRPCCPPAPAAEDCPSPHNRWKVQFRPATAPMS